MIEIIINREFTPEQKALFDKAEEVIEQNRDCISNICVADKYIDNYGTMVLSICGGQNGGGNWKDYFKGLSSMVSVLEKNGIDCWLLGGMNDCLDDVFNMEFGIKNMK